MLTEVFEPRDYSVHSEQMPTSGEGNISPPTTGRLEAPAQSREVGQHGRRCRKPPTSARAPRHEPYLATAFTPVPDMETKY